MKEKEFNKNVLKATIISAILITVWMYTFGGKGVQNERVVAQQEQIQEAKPTELSEYKITEPNGLEETKVLSRDTVLNRSKRQRIFFETEKLKGSILLEGLKFDDLVLKNYEEKLGSSEKVALLSPLNTENTYFADFGWLSADQNLKLPTSTTFWSTTSEKLTTDKPATFVWKNGRGLTFVTTISIDENYMFNIKQSVQNNSKNTIALIPYGRINKKMTLLPNAIKVVHQGVIGSFNKGVEEIPYKKLEKQNYKFDNGFHWMGLTDKYWQTAIIANKDDSETTVDFKFKDNNYRAEFKGKEMIIYAGQSAERESNLFAGAKELNVLDKYAKDLNIPLFDRSVDFGWFYFLTKPLYLVLKLFYNIIGNFGIAILLLTLLVKGAMYPIAQKSFVSMAKMKKLQPQLKALKAQYGNDKMELNKETMKLYQKAGISPLSGCLPTLVQIPVFFSLYKVLYVTIDMRHAPFFGFMKDLSASDPTNILNLFGLLPYQTGSMHIGLLPCLMSLTMFIQQKLNTQVASDETAQAMTKYMPIMFLFIFANFPSGLLIYWIFNNIITVGQQVLINKKLEKMK